MSTPIGDSCRTETPNSVNQTSALAEASRGGVGETPSSLCCFSRDGQDSIFTQVWRAISSFFSSLWSWITCSDPASRADRVPLDPSAQAQPALPLLQVEENGENTAAAELQATGVGSDTGDLDKNMRIAARDLLQLVLNRPQNHHAKFFVSVVTWSGPCSSVFTVIPGRGPASIEDVVGKLPMLGEGWQTIDLRFYVFGENEADQVHPFNVASYGGIVTPTSSESNLGPTMQWPKENRYSLLEKVRLGIGHWKGSEDPSEIENWLPAGEACKVPRSYQSQRELLLHWLTEK